MSRFSLRPRNRTAKTRKPSHKSRRKLNIDRLESRLMLAANPIPGLSDEFTDSASVAHWERIHEVEGWGAEQLAVYDVDDTQSGRMVQQPHTTVWYQDWRGPMAFKNVTGDFVFTTEIHITDRDDVGGSDLDDIPGDAQFSLAGAMIRTPWAITNPAVDWAPGSMAEDGTNNGENYVFLSLGYGNGGNEFSLEVKSTRNSNSQLELTSLGTTANTATVQIARIGDSIIMLYQLPGQAWQVHRRYTRADMPDTLQVGLVSYTDWSKASDFDEFVQNSSVLVPGIENNPTPGEPFNPDLTAGFEYARYATPDVPAALAGADLADPLQVSDGELLSFLGQNANIEPTDDTPLPQPDEPVTRVGMNLSTLVDWDPMWMFKDAFLRARPWVPRAMNIDTGESTWQFSVGDGPALELDSQGWVTSLQTWLSSDGNTYQQQAATVLFSEGANQPAGIYRAEWDGEGELFLPFVIESGVTPEGRNYALVDMPAGAQYAVQINETDPMNPIRNINFWMPDYEGQSLVGESWQPGSEESPFHPLFLERLDDFDTIRFMQLQNTIETDIVTWEDRRSVTHATQSDGDLVQYFHTNGIAPEYMVELANAIDANPWFNMPHTANDQFVENFATLVRDTLDPSLTIYVEWSNELWNAAFPTYSWLQEQTTLPENSGLDFFQVAGQEIQRDFDIWSDVFAGQEHRIVRVVAGQQANPWLTEQLLLNVDGRVDAVSVTAYADISFEMSQAYDATTTADDIIDDLLGISIPWAADRLQEHRLLVEEYEGLLGRDLQYVAYEGGAHVMGFPNDFVGSGAEAAAVEAMHSPRMYDVYTTLLNEVRDAGLDLYTEYIFTSPDSPNFYGSYGLLQDMATPLAEAHQLRALLDFANQSEPTGPLVSYELTILDEAGNPINQLEVGQAFTLQVTVDDLREGGSGVFSAFLDVNYDGALASPSGDFVFGDAYANAQEGDASVLGVVDELGAIASADPIGGEPRLLARIPMIATAVGEITFLSELADLLPDHEVTVYGLDVAVPDDAIQFGSATLNVVPATPPATAADDQFVVFNDGVAMELDVLANDPVNPADVPSLSVVTIDSVSGGTAIINAQGDRVLFTPAAGFYGEAQIEYTLSDAYGQHASATAFVTVQKRWTNPTSLTDVNGDGTTSPMDALIVINALIRHGAIPLPAVPSGTLAGTAYVDTNGDQHLTPADALQVINELIRKALERSGSGEGEAAPTPTILGNASGFAQQGLADASNPFVIPMSSFDIPSHPRRDVLRPATVDPLFGDDALIECWMGSDEYWL